LQGEFLTTGPAIPVFEAALQTATGARRAVAVNSGTAAIHAMYFAAGIRAGDEIITSPLTFAATANAALYLGATVRFIDVDPQTGLMDAEAVSAALTTTTRAVVAIDYAGHPADYPSLRQAIPEGVSLLADAAHSLGGTLAGRPVGTLADASALSFHPVKSITTAEGGAVVTDQDGLADAVARFRTHGITRDRSQMDTDDGPWFYEQIDLGFNYRLTDIQAALGTSQLERLPAFLSRRQFLAEAYLRELADVGGIQLPMVLPAVTSGWHLFVIRVPSPTRRTFFERLRELGLGVQVHYIPVYWHPYYRALGYRRGLCPRAEEFYSQAISLPLYPRMTDEEFDRVVSIVRRVAAELL
jgi:dTDP-4-amino-4,6-dideoxygalactose transaminase